MAADMNKLINGNGLLYGLKGLKAQITTLLGNKVDKVDGKGLSTNDFTTALKTKLDGIAEGANKYTHPTHTAAEAGLYKVTVDTLGHVTATTKVAKADITGLGIPAQDTTYSAATSSANGLMSASDKAKLDGFASAGTYATQTYVSQQIAAAGHITKSIVETLPEASAAKENVIYMIKKTTANGDNAYDEYMLVAGKLERIGDTQADISTMSNADIDEILASL